MVRVITYVLLAMGPMVVGINLLFEHGPWAPVYNAWHLLILLSYFFYATGLFFYTTRIPEKLYPGRFDIFVRISFLNFYPV